VRSTASAYWRPSITNQAQRCIAPATVFADPERNTSKPIVFRWFRRTNGEPFFFAGISRQWEGDRRTKKAPNVGKHKLYSLLTTAPNGIIEPIHNKAMPVLLMIVRAATARAGRRYRFGSGAGEKGVTPLRR
jgi:putative SOS response-associated peptidase YedK